MPNERERMWRQIRRSRECWLWTGCTASGSPVMHTGRGTKSVLRLTWEEERGTLPRRARMVNRCGQRLCVNPKHWHHPAQEERFLSHVEKMPSGCWEWRGARVGEKSPYGQFRIADGSMALAHRLAHEMWIGPIPRGCDVCHRCDNPPCVNPDHLFAGTDADNIADKMRKGRHPVGESAGRAILTERDVRAIRNSAMTSVALAKRYGVSHSTIAQARQRKTWRHI